MKLLRDFWSAFLIFGLRVLRQLDFRLVLALAVFFAVLTIILIKRLT